MKLWKKRGKEKSIFLSTRGGMLRAQTEIAAEPKQLNKNFYSKPWRNLTLGLIFAQLLKHVKLIDWLNCMQVPLLDLAWSMEEIDKVVLSPHTCFGFATLISYSLTSSSSVLRKVLQWLKKTSLSVSWLMIPHYFERTLQISVAVDTIKTFSHASGLFLNISK